MTSNVYRLSSSSANADESAKLDGENRYLWRMNPVRMEAQTIRDSLLHLAGELDTTMGGPPVPIAQQDASRRRSMYFFHSHNEHNKLLDVFDNANVLECYRRIGEHRAAAGARALEQQTRDDDERQDQ